MLTCRMGNTGSAAPRSQSTSAMRGTDASPPSGGLAAAPPPPSRAAETETSFFGSGLRRGFALRARPKRGRPRLRPIQGVRMAPNTPVSPSRSNVPATPSWFRP